MFGGKKEPVSEWGKSPPGKKAGVEIWRIENLKPVIVPTKQFGKFFE